MNMMILLEQFSPEMILAALIPSILFIGLILYYTLILPHRFPKPKIVKVKEPIYVIGVSTKTSKESFFEDDMILWKEYKRVKEKDLIKNKKEEHSFVAVRKASESDKTWEYLIGDIVNDHSDVPVGLRTVEIPASLYAVFPIHVADEHSWGPAIVKTEKIVYEKWLPNSRFELNTASPIREIEYHDKRTPDSTRTMLFYVAIKPKR